MENVLRSSLDKILLALQARLVASLGWDQSRVVIDSEGDEQQNEGHYQAEQVVFIRKGSETPNPDFQGMGRVWASTQVRINFTLWTRTALDEAPGYAIGMTDPVLGHEPAALAIRNAMDAFQPADNAGNWLVQQPMEPAGATPVVRRKQVGYDWSKSTLTSILTYAPATDQAYQ